MIDLRYGLPLVRSSRGDAVSFESIRLRCAVQEAASRAGYENWWLVDDLVAGISLYLRKDYVKTVIDWPELESMVCAALRNIGYDEVAASFRAVPPVKGISLLQCLNREASANHSTFFEQLSVTIGLLWKSQVRHFHFYDLQACVNQLENEGDSGRHSSSEGLGGLIVAFVREHVHAREWNQPVWCSIS